MDGKVFFRSSVTPPPIPKFVFDLQRFAFQKLENDATIPNEAIFSVVKNDGTYYGTDAADFTTGNLNDGVYVGSGTESSVKYIKLLKDLTLTQDVNIGNNRIWVRQVSVTLDLAGHNLTTSNNTAIVVTPKYCYGETDTAKTEGALATSLTINNTGGDNSGTKGSIISSNSGWAVVVTGDGNENHAPSLTVNGGYIKSGDAGISGLGNDGSNGNHQDDRHINITINDGNIIGGGPEAKGCGLYFPGMGNLKITGGTITGGTGVEIRAGSLAVTGGTIQAGFFDESGKFVSATTSSFEANGNGSSSVGVGLAVSQHTTQKKIEVNVSGDANISGAVALAVDNPQHNQETDEGIAVEIDGGTFESTATGTAAIAAQNADSRVSIKVKKGTFKGKLESTFATTGTGENAVAAIEITGEVTVETIDENGETVVTKYDSTSLQYKVSNEGEADKYETVSKGWNKIQATEDWRYLEAKSGSVTEAEAKATLAPAEGSTSILNLKTAASGLTTLALDMTTDLFKELTNTTIDASNGSNTVAFNITGNAQVTSILGGKGGDTLRAGANGSSLNGGTGDDLLIGSSDTSKADTFIFTSGADSIQGYRTNDVVSLGSDVTAPTSFSNVKYTDSDYVVSLGANSGGSLTFKATNTFSITNGTNIFSYAPGSIVSGDGVTIGSSYYKSKTFNGASEANSSFKTIDASAVEHAIKITGNSNANLIIGSKFGGTLLGGDENDTLVANSVGTYLNGGDGADSLVGFNGGGNVFIYTGGNDKIKNYTTKGTDKAQDLVSVASGINIANATVTTSGTGTTDLVIGFDSSNSLTFEGGGASTISLQSGRKYYTFSASSIALAADKSITLTANFAADSFAGGETYNNIDASLVSSKAISITGNENDNYIIGGASGGSLSGLAGNDTLVGGKGNDIFHYTEGKDVILEFGKGSDSLSIDTNDISKARASNRRLTFTMTDKKNTLVFRSNDSIPAQISLAGGDYLTKDGVVKDNSLKLFSSAKGRIDLTDTTLYNAASIEAVDASAVDKQSVTLVGGTQGGSFTFATNKKRDGFEYKGGAVSISGYESGKDRINLGDYSISGFTADGTKVAISLGAGNATGAISLMGAGAKGSEVMIHQSTNKGNSYSKMVFADTGVLYDKKKATSATLSTGASSFNVESTDVKSTLRKIIVGAGVENISITAGDSKNTVIDASLASGTVSLVSGAQNDKFTGSAYADMFVYTAGKDIIQDFNIGGVTDQISLKGSDLKLENAKITASKKSIKFKFGPKDVLTVKPTKGDTLSDTLTINGLERTYAKNAIINDKAASLTSAFGGTYKIADGISTVDGSLVKKNLTFKATSAGTNETLFGGQKKTTFKGAGGTDSLVGGSGSDIFFYAKGDKGTATIANFDFKNDKLKIAGGTLAKVSSISGGGVQFGMKEGRGTDAPEVGWFDVKTSATYAKSENQNNVAIDASKVFIKANNTYYWFAKEQFTEQVTIGGESSTITIDAGDLITWDKKVSSSDVGKDAAVIELNYGTNLVKSGVAVAVSKDNDKAQL